MMRIGLSLMSQKCNSYGSRLETRRTLNVSFVGLGGSLDLMMILLSFLCRSPFDA